VSVADADPVLAAGTTPAPVGDTGPGTSPPGRAGRGPARRRTPGQRLAGLGTAAWPPLVAVALVLVIWEIAAVSGWKPAYLLPAPTTVLPHLGLVLQYTETWQAIATTLERAVVGFGLSLVIGAVLGIAVARVSVLRRGIGSLVSALQTMPSVAWFPFALLLFGLNESAILFVVVLGAAPSIANGFADGIATVPPHLVRVGQVLGARGLRLYRDVLLPAALPSVVASLRQAWAFAWRSLLAGELLTTIPGKLALGQQLAYAQDNSDVPDLLSDMIILLALGIVVDLAFRRINGSVLRRRGLTLGQS
jgi:NitT/TauT family transport system permease protein